MKRIDAKTAAGFVQDGMTIMVGGFMSNGAPEALIDALIERGVRNLTVISNDTGLPGTGMSKLVAAGNMKRLMASHIGLNPETGVQMNAGILDVELIPQGTLAEQIRAGGAGLGGVLTPTGVGTDVALGKQTLDIDGQTYLLEKPLRADVALLYGTVVDGEGNVFYRGTTRNFNVLMATAADIVIVEAERVVPTGALPGENIVTPGIFVDYVVGGEDE